MQTRHQAPTPKILRSWCGAARRFAVRGVASTLVTGGLLLGAFVTHAAAQCAMCGSGTPYAGTSLRHSYATLAAAALVLLLPTLGLLGALARLLWKYRD